MTGEIQINKVRILLENLINVSGGWIGHPGHPHRAMVDFKEPGLQVHARPLCFSSRRGQHLRTSGEPCELNPNAWKSLTPLCLGLCSGALIATGALSIPGRQEAGLDGAQGVHLFFRLPGGDRPETAWVTLPTIAQMEFIYFFLFTKKDERKSSR